VGLRHTAHLTSNLAFSEWGGGGGHSGGYIAGIIWETESYGRTQRREGFSAVRQLTRVREHTEGGMGERTKTRPWVSQVTRK